MFIVGIRALNESDIFYHIKAGEVIWQTKSIPTTDIFSSSAFGARWVTHEWLPELIFFGVYSLASFWGLIVLIGICVATASYLLVFIALRRGSNFSLAVIITFILTLFSLPYWKARPQIFGYLAFAVLVALLEHYRRHNNIRTLWLACGVMLVWANFSASFLLGVVVFVYYGLSLYIHARITRAPIEKLRGAQWMIAASVFGTALGLINPNTYSLFTYPLVIAPAVRIFDIVEWKSILEFLSLSQMRALLMTMALVDAFFVWWFIVRKESRDLVLAGLIAGMSALPFISSRHVIFWILLASFILPAALSQLLKEKFNRFNIQLTWSLIVLFASILTIRAFMLPSRYYDASLIPVGAVNFIEEQNIKGPLFNLYNEGGYLMFRLWPRERIFIDGRSEVFVGKPIDDYVAITKTLGDWKRLLNDAYRVQYLVLPYWPEFLARTIAPLTNALISDKEWVLVYWDDVATIYVRNSDTNKELIARYGAHIVTPFKHPKNIAEGDVGKARDELLAFAKRSPESEFIAWYVRDFRAAHLDFLKKLNK